mmetsp:Transcript_6538/g.10153  ORF Transcript_6538/g.10153 Transcript_6538/m.10153 type:complete len:370 (-) Transcript_6538:344-1453(-)
MGALCACASGITPEERAALAAERYASQQLDSDLKQAHGQDIKIHKLLLLGTGESGKSTIFKQMQILYDKERGFSAMEKSTFKHVIRTNVVEAMQALIDGIHKHNIQYQHGNSPQFVQKLKALDSLSTDFWVPQIVEYVVHLWRNEKAIQHMFENRAKIHLLDSAEYLFENVERIGEDDYMPNKDDILRARLRTSGIHEKVFDIHDIKFKFLDVGGQRNERRKWIHCFQDVTSVIFVAAISEYDQRMYEDETKNRMHETLEEFQKISNLDIFKETAFILFLNKMDLFEKKVRRVNMKEVCFPDFQGKWDSVDECLEYVTQRFVLARTFPSEGFHIYPHTTCATDTQHIEKVFEACKLIILQSNLEKLGIS